MDYRFIAGGIVAATIGFVSGSTVFASPSRPAVDPTIASVAAERQAVDAAAAEVPPVAPLPALPKLPAARVAPAPVFASAKVKAPVRVRRTTRRVTHRVRVATPTRRSPRHHEQDHQSHDDGGGGGDD